MELVTIEDRKFFCIGPEAGQIHIDWLLSVIAKCNLHEVARQESETYESFRDRIFLHLLLRTDIFELIAGIMLPVELPTGSLLQLGATEHGYFFRNLTKPQSKRAFRIMAGEAVLGFLRSLNDRIVIATAILYPKFICRRLQPYSRASVERAWHG